MTSAHRSSSLNNQQDPQQGTAKKKFGKNLNKLTKPPAPPIASSSKACSSSSSHNGLLLLSTKRSTAGGLLANKTTPSNDALLGLVVGATCNNNSLTLESQQQQPDAWGVAAERKAKESETTTDTRTLAPKGGVSSFHSPPREKRPHYEQHVEYYEPHDQAAYMARLAKTRAEKRRAEEERRMMDLKERASQRLKELEQKTPRVVLEKLVHKGAVQKTERNTAGRTLFDPNRTYSSLVGGTAVVEEEEEEEKSEEVIHLSSYEDRDRGERNGPRMLYDPKSGSMVAVPTRRKARKARNAPTRSQSDVSKDDGSKTSRRQRRKDEPRKKEPTPKKSQSRLPRTCGVLYARDDKGNFFCADGCDADLGYGAHSVPGGRVKNPNAHAKYLLTQKQLYPQDNNEGAPSCDNDMEGTYDNDQYSNPEVPVTLDTGFKVVEKQPETHIVDWVKPNEKIELVTGVEESPTLQATAKEWAPSEAALAAAAAAAAKPMSSVASVDSNEDVDDGDDEDTNPDITGFAGLGFDPAQGVDSVIQSPTAKPTGALDSVDLAALGLEPALQSSSTATGSRHIFAFGSCATWGSNGGSNNDWGATSNGARVLSSETFAREDQTVNAASFLALTNGGWGGVASLGGSPLDGK